MHGSGLQSSSCSDRGRRFQICKSPAGQQQLETPVLVMPLLMPEHDGQDLYAEEHMSMEMVERWNDRCGGPDMPPRPSSGRRPSVSELEAAFEVRVAPGRPACTVSTPNVDSRFHPAVTDAAITGSAVTCKAAQYHIRAPCTGNTVHTVCVASQPQARRALHVHVW